MALQISRTDAKLNIETMPSHLSIQNRQARLELSLKEAKVEIHTEMPRVVIDQSDCFATSGLMKPIDLTRQAGRKAMQQAMAYAGKVAGDGDAMAAIENNSNMIAAIAKRDSTTVHEYGIGIMPEGRPKISVTGGGVEINIRNKASDPTNGVEGTITPGGISFNYTPSQVNISMAQYASIRIKYVPSGFNAYA